MKPEVKKDATAGRLLFCLLPFAFCLALASGCASDSASKSTTRPSSTRARQDKAMKDPFNYSPDTESTDISGGGLTDFDRQGFNRDMKNVLDP